MGDDGYTDFVDHADADEDKAILEFNSGERYCRTAARTNNIKMKIPVMVLRMVHHHHRSYLP